MGNRSRHPRYVLRVAAALLAVPATALAALEPDTSTGEGLFELLGRAAFTLNLALPLAVSFAVFCFFWGIARFILNSKSEEGREKGKQFMLWSVVALFVLVSIWGIVGVLSSTFGVGLSGKCRAPSILGDTVETCGFNAVP